jgi:hypothetical protein
MRKKVKLDRANGFEEYVAAYHMADMLAKFLSGDVCPSAIGSEQGIPKWDDIIIWHHDGCPNHVQVKRQVTDFSPDSPVRRKKKKGPNIGKPQDLSPLDKTIEALGEAYKDVERLNDHIFTLSVITTTNIKSNISVSHFQDLCRDCANETVTAAGLKVRAGIDAPTQNLFDWLTTWCGFDDWDHILRALSRLTIEYTGNEQDLENRSEVLLRPFFINPKKVVSEIRSFFHDNGTDASETTPRILLNHLISFIKADFQKWTAYRHDRIKNNWDISGIHCLDDIEVEKAAPVVSRLWSGIGEAKSLRIEANCQVGSHPALLPTALIRLGLHFSSPAQMMIRGKDAWVSSASDLCGGTLGVALNEFSNLPWLELNYDLKHINDRVLSTTLAQDEEAKGLLEAMDNQTWKLICVRLGELIRAEPKVDTRHAMETLWNAWRSTLNIDEAARSEFLTRMMSIASEPKSVNPCVRVGPLTIEELAVGIKLNLLVVLALFDTKGSQKHCGDKGVKTISLKVWGGTGDEKRVRSLSEDKLSVLLGSESAPVVIMAGVECSPNELSDELMGDDVYSSNSLMSEKKPHLLVTNSPRVKRLIRNNSFEEVKKYFQDKARVNDDARDKAVNQIGE